MAKKSNPPSRGQAPQRRGNPAPKAAPQPKRKTKEAAAEEASAGNILWRLALIFCTALVFIALIYASFTGGSELVGAPTPKPDGTSTPPVASIDPNQTVSGSAATPIPPSPTPIVPAA